MNPSEQPEARWNRWRAQARTTTGQLRRAVGRERRGSDAQLVWIMGSPRTGSTWLVNLLAFVTGSPMIDEPLIGVHLATPVSAITARPGEGTDGLVSEMFADRPDYFFSDAHADVWIPALRELVVRRLFADLPPERDQRLVLVKEPNGSLAAPMLMRCLPRSRLLFLVRDGRDVVDSVLDGLDGGWMGESFGLDVAGYGGRAGVLASRAQRWVDDTAAVQQAYDARPANLRMMLRYEDLLAEPVDRLVDVLAWLGRQVPRDEVEHVVEQLDRDRVPEDQRGKGKFVRAATPGLWSEHFDDNEQAMLDRIMGPTLRSLGYH